MNQKPSAIDSTSEQPVMIPAGASPRHDEALLDQAVAETFPASDPISPAMSERLEPGDVRRETYEGGAANARVQRMSPTLIALGVAAFSFLVMRAFRRSRAHYHED